MKNLTKVKSYLSLINEFCNKQMLLQDGVTNYYEDLIARQLIANYHSIEELGIKRMIYDEYALSPRVNVKTETITKSQLSSPNKHLASAVESLDSVMQYTGGSFYIYGSAASADSVDGWSDLDSMLIVDQSILGSVEGLIDLRRLILSVNEELRKIDPLQHHGVLIQPRTFLDFHLDTSIPINNLGPILTTSNSNTLIQYRTIQTGLLPQKLTGILQDVENCDVEGVMRHHPFKGEHLLANYKNSNNGMYQLKYFLGLFTILPSLVAQLLKEDSYKPVAVGAVKKILDDQSKDWLERITDLRSNWNSEANAEYIQNNRIPPQVYNYIPANYFSLGASFARVIRDLIPKQH